MKALIIDDSGSMRMLLARILDDLGVSHAEAADGSLALEKLNSEGPFDFALVDWQMPVMDGIEFVRQTRARFGSDVIKLLMVTSVNQIESVVEALEAGADEYIMKPFTKEALHEKLALLGIELKDSLMIRVMIVDDSVVVRKLLSMVLTAEADIEVVYEAKHGRDALDHLEAARPDLLTLDVEMPVLDGIGTLRELRARRQRLPVIMFSTLTSKGAATTLEALSLGASDYMTKPESVSGLHEALESIGHDLVPRIRALVATAQRRRAALPARTAPALAESPRAVVAQAAARAGDAPAVRSRTATVPPPLRKPAVTPVPEVVAGPRQKIDLVVIGVSTGGPNALAKLIPRLPGTFPVPLLIVQHMPPLFTRMLAERLDQQCALTIREAVDKARIKAGEVWIARGDWHMEVHCDEQGLYLSENQNPPVNSCRPAVDPLFRSAVKCVGRNLLAVVLTGMGRDGADGAREVRAAGGNVIVQDEASSVVWGMPGAVVNDGSTEQILKLEDLAANVIQRVTHRRTATRETAHGA